MSLLFVRRFRLSAAIKNPIRGILSGKWPVVASAAEASDAEDAPTAPVGDVEKHAETRPTDFSATPFDLGSAGPTQGPRILILDDEVSVRRVCTFALRGLGWQPEGEGSAQTALKRIRDGETFDVIVLDYAMPDMNGLEFLRALNELPESKSRPLVLMASAHADGAVAKQAMQLGVWDFLAKPLMPDDIRRRTRRLLKRQANAARGEKVAAALLHARAGRWTAALQTLENVTAPSATLLRGLLQEVRGDIVAAQQEYARAYWSAGWSAEHADVWAELSRRLDVDDDTV